MLVARLVGQAGTRSPASHSGAGGCSSAWADADVHVGKVLFAGQVRDKPANSCSHRTVTIPPHSTSLQGRGDEPARLEGLDDALAQWPTP